jgi:hypothetical protein
MREKNGPGAFKNFVLEHPALMYDFCFHGPGEI